MYPPKIFQIQRHCSGVQNLQSRNHRNENAQKKRGNLRDRMEVEMVRMVNRTRGRVPREHGHREHDAFLNPPRPTKVSTQNRCAHDSHQIKNIDATLNMNSPERLDVFGKRARRFDVLLHKNVLIENVEDDQENSYRKCPLWDQSQCPVERHATQESQE